MAKWRLERQPHEGKILSITLLLSRYISYWRRAFDFKGCANRKEYWHPLIVNGIISLLSANVATMAAVNSGGSAVLTNYYYFIMFWGALNTIPSLSINARRLRDAGTSVWWAPYFFIDRLVIKNLPSELAVTGKAVYYIGLVYLIYLLAQPSKIQNV